MDAVVLAMKIVSTAAYFFNMKKYDKNAVELANSYYLNYDYKAYKNKLRKLINKFISEVLKND